LAKNGLVPPSQPTHLGDATAPTPNEWLVQKDKGTTEMNKVILPVAVLVVGAAAYFYYTSQTTDLPDAAVETPAVAQEPEPVTETVEETAEEAAQEAVAEAVETTQDAAQEAAEAVEEQIESAIESASELANEAAEAVGQAVDEASQAVSTAADNAASTLGTDTETGLTEAETEAALTPATFDYDRAVQVIDNADISETQKTLLKSGLDQALNNPALLENLLQQARTALGM
jgi:colicin import membrane protein